MKKEQGERSNCLDKWPVLVSSQECSLLLSCCVL